MRWMIWVCLLVIFACSCTRHHRLGEMTDQESTYFQKRSSNDIITVFLWDGRISRGTGLVLDHDEYVWTNVTSNTQERAATAEVRRIEILSHKRGFADGFGTGFVAGSLFGGVLGYVGGEDCGDGGGDWICFSRGDLALAGVILIGIPSAIIGTIVGGAKGSRDIYTVPKSYSFGDSSAVQIQPTEPAGVPVSLLEGR